MTSTSRRLLLVAVALLSVWGLSRLADATEPTPPELQHVCVDDHSAVYQVDSTSGCTSKEQAFDLPQDRPFTFCAATTDGKLRRITGGGCTSKETGPYTVPDSGPLSVCAKDMKGTTRQPRGQLYLASDGPSSCTPKYFTAFVTPAAPVAAADAYSTGEDTLLTVPARGVLSNDTDTTGQPLVARLVSGPSAGALALSPDGSFTFDPRGQFDWVAEGQQVTVSFSYVANDGALDSPPATVTLTVVGSNDAPVAHDDAFTTDEDTALAVVAPGLLANDTDAEHQPLTTTLVAGPSRGHLTLGTDGSLRFDPTGAFDSLADGQSSTVSFTYQAGDGSARSTAATVTITVTGRDDAPVAQADHYSTDENTPIAVPAPGVLGNDSDVDGPPVTAALISASPAAAWTLHTDGSFTFDPRHDFDGLQDGQSGQATLTYRATDGTLSSAPTTVTVDVSGISAPAAADDTARTDQATPVALDVTANDAPHGGRLSAVDTSGSLGRVSGPDSRGVLTYDPGSAFTSLPAGRSAVDSFRYTLTNSEGVSTATVRVTVDGLNDAPVARPDSGVVDEGHRLVVPAGTGVLANDSDVDGDPLTAVLVGPPGNGRLDLSPDGSYSYQPAGDTPAGSSATVTFSYRASDGRAESPTTTVTLTVRGVNAPPSVPAGQVLGVVERSAAGTPVGRVTFSDPDAGQSHTWAITSGNGGGSGVFAIDDSGLLTVADGSSLDHAATPRYQLGVTVTDSSGASGSGTVEVDVAQAARGLLAAADTYATAGNTELVTGNAGPASRAWVRDPRTVLANDSSDAGPVHAVPASGVTTKGGHFTVDSSGGVRYDPPAGVLAPAGDPDTFTYTADDGTSTAIATVSVVVGPAIWYVDAAAPGGGDGTAAHPFQSPGPVAGTGAGQPDVAGDTVYLFSGSNPYTVPVTLESGERLVGQGTPLVSGGVAVVTPATSAAPVLSTTGSPALTLGSGNSVMGVDLSSTGAPALTGAAVGTLGLTAGSLSASGAPALVLSNGTLTPPGTVGTLTSRDSSSSGASLTSVGGALTVTTASVTGPSTDGLHLAAGSGSLTVSGGSIAGGSGSALSVSGGTGVLQVGASLSAGSAGRSLEIADLTGAPAAVTVSGPVSDSGKGVWIHGNPAATPLRFTGGLALSTGSAPAFTATGGGLLEITGSANTASTTTGTAVSLDGLGIGPAGATWRSIASNGAPYGLSVSHSRGLGTGTFTVTGSGSNDSGGIIQNATAGGIALTDSGPVTLARMRVSGGSGHGIALTDTAPVVLDSIVVQDVGADGVHGVRTTGLTVKGATSVLRSRYVGVDLTDALGRTSFTGATLKDSHGTAQLSVSNATASAAAPATPTDVLSVDASQLGGGAGDLVDVTSTAAGNLAAAFGGANTNVLTQGAGGVVGNATAGGHLTTTVTRLQRVLGTGDAVALSASGADAASGRLASVTGGVTDNSNSRGGAVNSPGGAGVSLLAGSGGSVDVAVTGNTITQPGGNGVSVTAAGGTVVAQVEANQIFKPGCAATGVDLCTAQTVTSGSSTSQKCGSSPSGPLPGGVVLRVSDGGALAPGTTVRSNEVTDPLGSGLSLAQAGSAATLDVTGNRLVQTSDCSSRAAVLTLAATAGTTTLSGGTNTLVGTTGTTAGRQTVPMESFAASGSGVSATVTLASDSTSAGDVGLLASTSGGATLTLSSTDGRFADAGVDGVRGTVVDAGSLLDLGLHRATVSGSIGRGVTVDPFSGAALVPGHGIYVAHPAGTLRLVVDASSVTSDAAPTFVSMNYFDGTNGEQRPVPGIDGIAVDDTGTASSLAITDTTVGGPLSGAGVRIGGASTSGAAGPATLSDWTISRVVEHLTEADSSGTYPSGPGVDLSTSDGAACLALDHVDASSRTTGFHLAQSGGFFGLHGFDPDTQTVDQWLAAGANAGTSTSDGTFHAC